MSSLRLALKQSLEETGGATIGGASSSNSSSSDSSSVDHSPHASPDRDDIHRGGSSHSHNSNNTHHRNNNSSSNDHHHHSQHGPPSVKRGPGRPRKHPLPGQQQQPTSSLTTTPASDHHHHPVHRKRGRPPRSKQQQPVMMTTSHQQQHQQHHQHQSHDPHHDDDDFSSENEFSHEEEEEEEEEEEDSAEEEEFEGDGEDEADHKEHDDDGDEEEDEDDDDGDEEEDEEEQGTRSRSRHNHQHRRRQQHQRQHQRSSAASKIQSHWKKKKQDGPAAASARPAKQQHHQHATSSVVNVSAAGTHSTQHHHPSSSHNKRQSPEPSASLSVEPRDHRLDTSSSHHQQQHQQQQHPFTTSRSSPTHAATKSPTSLTTSAAAAASMPAAAAASEPTKRVMHQEEDDNNNKTRDKNASAVGATGASTTTKSKTVPPPMPEVLEWTRNLPIKRARKHVSQGLRVKVRFSTKVKRDGKVVRKKKWFGGRVSAVSKKGSKIRIKYDDGTTEETKFPDKDVVVDDTSNGQHNASVGGAAEKFSPPTTTQSSHHDGGSHGNSSHGHLHDDREIEHPSASTSHIEHQHPRQPARLVHHHQQRQQQHHHHTAEQRVGTHERKPPSTTGLGETSTTDASVVPNRKQSSPVVAVASDVTDAHASMEQNDANSVGALATKIKRKRGRPPKHRPSVTSASAEEGGDATPGGGDSSGPHSKKNGDGHYESTMADGRDRSGSHDSEEASNNNNNRTGMYSSAGEADTKHQQLQHAELPQQQYRHTHQHLREDMAAARADAFAVAEPGADRNADVQASPSNIKPTLTIRLSKLKQNVDRSEPTTENDMQVDQQQPAAAAAVGSAMDEGAAGGEFPLDRPRKKRPASAEPNESGEPPLKRLHIHISKSKKGTTESTDKQQHDTSRTPTPGDGESSTTNTGGGGGDEPSRPMPMRAKQPHSSPSSNRKLKRKRLESAEHGPALPITTRVVKSTAENREGVAAAFAGANQIGSNDKKEGVVGSKNSAFDKKDGALSVKLPPAEDGGQLSETNKAATLTPRGGRKKKDAAAAAAAAAAFSAEDLALSVRSGRRAAQQANERITAKPDSSDKEQLGKKKKKRGKHHEGGDVGEDAHNNSNNPEGGAGEFQWVQCDGCGKWRVIPSVVVDTLPAQWFCADNKWDPKRATCDAPEQTAKQIAKEKKRKKRQRLLMEKAAAEEAAAAGEIPPAQPEASAYAATDRERPKSPPEGKEDSATTTTTAAAEESLAAHNSTSNKPARRPSPADSLHSESGATSDTNKQEKKPSAVVVKKGKGSVDAVAPPEEAPPTTEPKRGRGRPRRKPTTDGTGPQPPTPGKEGGDEGDNLEWVQCEKCDKWRKLPPHISADELPDVWYCSMNTWNPKSASCEAPEDKAEGLQDIFNNGGSGAVKLSYRNLIFGSNGRKNGRPISERTRAAESLFATVSDDNEAPPTVMYATSCAFQSRSKAHQQCEENEQPSILDIMTQSHLWKELNGTADEQKSGGTSEKQMPLYSFDMLPVKHKEAMKDLALNCVATQTLTGDEVHAEIQARNWEDNVPQGWTAVRGYCTVNILVMALCQLVKEGVLECVQKKVITAEGLQDWDLAYRRAKSYSQAILPVASRGICGPELSMDDGQPRCSKFSKPWKRNPN